MRSTLNLIQEELIAQILAEAKQILNEIGVEVRGTQLRQRLLDHGLRQNPTSGRLSFPPDVVDNAIATTPRSFTLYDRNGEPCAELGGDRVHFVPGSSTTGSS